MSVRQAIQDVTDRIAARSRDSRRDYLNRLDSAKEAGVYRSTLSCGNLAHGFAACTPAEKAALAGNKTLNLGIVTSYNDMLSAHQPYQFYPEIIKDAARAIGATAQVAGGVPAMCDGVTQGQPGMDLSLFSRDVIAMATAISLSHNMFDAAVYLGICDKIVPGLLIGALTFGHLPAVFVPAGPMPSGMPNDEKSKIRQLYMEGKVGRAELLEAESKSYHSAGTCTFYGTANSNQMLMEIMGLHLPGASFVNPGTPLRDALTKEATRRALSLTAQGNDYTPVGHVIDEKSIVNGLVGLHATGGSTNHTMHLIAIAAAAGLHVTWDDMSDLSDATPLLARVYPNGVADVNHFHAAGGMGFLIQELLASGHLHEDVKTVWGNGLSGYAVEAKLIEDKLTFEASPERIGAAQGVDRRRHPIPNLGRPQAALRQSRPLGDQGLCRQTRAPHHRSPSPRVPRPGGPAGRFQGRRTQWRHDRRGPLLRPPRHRHARTAQADPGARRAAGSRLQGRPAHRWPHVRRFGQGACRHPYDPRSRGRWPDQQNPRRRPDPPRRQ